MRNDTFSCNLYLSDKFNLIPVLLLCSFVDPNRLCPDPYPGSHVHSDPDPIPEPNRIRGSYLNFSDFLKIENLTVVKKVVWRMKFFSQLIFMSFLCTCTSRQKSTLKAWKIRLYYIKCVFGFFWLWILIRTNFLDQDPSKSSWSYRILIHNSSMVLLIMSASSWHKIHF